MTAVPITELQNNAKHQGRHPIMTVDGVHIWAKSYGSPRVTPWQQNPAGLYDNGTLRLSICKDGSTWYSYGE